MNKGETALHYAAKCSSKEIIKILLEYGCKPDQTDNSGKTALHCAAEKTGYSNIIKILLKYGCKPDQKDNKGRTALHVAASQELVDSDFIRILLDSGCTPDERDKKGMDPLDLFEQMVEGSGEIFKRDRIKTRKLLREEGYNHYEARVMLAGEQGTGKTTIARYLVGKGPTKIRISTDGIDLYNGLSFIDRESEEWMPGKQGFTLSEVAISRSLRQSEAEVISSSLPVGGTSTGFELDGKLTDRDEKSSDIPASQDFTSSTADSSHCIPFLSLNEITLANDLDIIDRIEVVNDALLEHGEIPRDEVIYIRSENDQGLVQDKDLPNQYSSSLDDIRKADVFIEKQTKTKGTKETFPVIPRESAEEAQRRAKQVATPLIDQLETIENSSDEHMVPLNESPDSAKEKGDFSHAESHSKPHIKSQEIGTTTEVVKDRGIIGKLKKLFGVQKDVTEIKVSMTKDKFLKESIKAGKKKLHQKK